MRRALERHGGFTMSIGFQSEGAMWSDPIWSSAAYDPLKARSLGHVLYLAVLFSIKRIAEYVLNL